MTITCQTGKVAHTLKTATAAAQRARRHYEKPLAPYHCPMCGQWHVGQSSGMKAPIKTISKEITP